MNQSVAWTLLPPRVSPETDVQRGARLVPESQTQMFPLGTACRLPSALPILQPEGRVPAALRAAGRREGCAPAGTRGRGQDILFRRGTWGRGEDPGLWEPRGQQHPSRAQPNHSHWKTPNEAKSPLREEDAPGPDALGMSRAPTPAPARCSAAPRPRSWTRQSLASHPERTGNTVAQLRDTNLRAFNSSHCDWKHFVTNSLRRTRTTFLTVMYQLNWTI